MAPEDFDDLLRESAFFRAVLVDQLRASEQALAILATAVAGQIDAGRLAADLLALQRASAVEDPNPTRDRLLNTLRGQLQLPRPD